MLRSSVFCTIDFCTRHAWLVIVLAFALAAASSVYTARNFAIKTDVNDLFAPDLPWTQRAFEYMRTFPQPDILVVVDAPTPELVERASGQPPGSPRLSRHVEILFALCTNREAAAFSSGTDCYTCRPARLPG
jgi:general stress protein CsbA